jgi:hypothetical protein
MTLQWLLVALAAGMAAAFLARQTWRTWSGGCGKGCGCSTSPRKEPALIGTDELTSRLRTTRHPR